MSVNNPTPSRLEDYLKSPVKDVFENNMAKGTLLFLTPFVASTFMPNAISAQSCGLYTNGVVQNTLYTFESCPVSFIDFNNDGANDFVIFKFITNSNPLVQIVAYSFYSPNTSSAILGATTNGRFYASNVASGATVNPAAGTNKNAIIAYGGGSGSNFAMPSSGNIPIRLNGNLGFVEITIDANGCVTVGSFGVQDPNDPDPTVLGGICSSLLPVEFVSFNAVAKDMAIHLTWTTASERGCAGFEVQRSLDGEVFNKIGFVDGHGNSDQKESYLFQDSNPRINNTYYYRLKQIDFDGGYDFTDVISAKITLKDSPVISRVFPNPTNDKATLEINVPNSSSALIEIYDNFGRVVHTSEEELFRGDNRIDLPTEMLQHGAYFAKMVVEDQILYEKFIKK